MAGYQLGSAEAYYFDRGVWIWATRIESEMDKAASRLKGKSNTMVAAARSRVLNSYIRPGDPKGLYRDPARLAPKRTSGDVKDGMVIGGDSHG